MPDTRPYTRLLQYRLPLVRGEDVMAVQKQLRALGFSTGAIDGVYGPRTEGEVRKFQTQAGLPPDGIVGPMTWNRLLKIEPANDYRQRLKALLPELTQAHAFRDSVRWQLRPDGISIDDKAPQRSPGKPETVARVWRDLRAPLIQWSTDLGVPLELIIATICTESGGKLDIAARKEPGYISDEETPHRISPGIMQTLIATARSVVGHAMVDRAWLEQPANSIQAGTAYIASQWKSTHFDPPKVACAYNAGGVYYNSSDQNRWKMRQYPIGTDKHANRFVEWFNDCFAVLGVEPELPAICFVGALKNSGG
jgi:hypothetical protein